jgi:hypothetical protein
MAARRIAKPGSKWTSSDLDAYNIRIHTVDTQAFFSVPHLPAPMVDPIILNHVNRPVGLPWDLRLFFDYLHAVTACEFKMKKAFMTKFSIQLMSKVLQLGGSSCWMPRRDQLHFVMSGKEVGAVGITMRRGSEGCILLVEGEVVSFPLLPP